MAKWGLGALLVASIAAPAAWPQRAATKPALNVHPASGELNIVAANVQLLLIAPDGRKTGYDARSKKKLRAIPESTYDEDALLAYDTGAVDLNTTQTLNVRHPLAGKYRLMVSSGSLADGQEYEVQVHLYRRDGSEASIVRLAGTVKRDAPATYEFELRSGPAGATIVNRGARTTSGR
jgi:hypothetical protein